MRTTPTLAFLNTRLAGLGVRIHKVPHRGLVRFIILQPAYTVCWGRLQDAWADLRTLALFQEPSRDN